MGKKLGEMKCLVSTTEVCTAVVQRSFNDRVWDDAKLYQVPLHFHCSIYEVFRYVEDSRDETGAVGPDVGCDLYL
jgi:hypothetical protein